MKATLYDMYDNKERYPFLSTKNQSKIGNIHLLAVDYFVLYLWIFD